MPVSYTHLDVYKRQFLYSTSAYNGRVKFHDSSYYFKKQLFATSLGLMGMYLISCMDYHVLVRFAPFFYLISLLLSLAVLLFGDEYNGSKRWLSIGPLSFQPSEFAKVAVILLLTWVITVSYTHLPTESMLMEHWEAADILMRYVSSYLPRGA